MADDFVFEIQEHIGVLSEGSGGWRKELNKVSFNGRPAKYDIRDWNEGYEKMRKGVSLSDEEMKELKALLGKIDL